MTLNDSKKGQKVHILSINDEIVRAQAIRFGIAVGAEVKCAEKIPAGPVILACGRQEIAIGKHLAESIQVRPV